MPKLTEHKREDFLTLLACDVLDASKGVLLAHEAKLQPDTTNRTILIGVGGMGVRTIDNIKGAISGRLDASWRNYVAFLGIDADWKELDGLAYLEMSEQLMITKSGVADRMRNPQTYPSAVRRFAVDSARMRLLSACWHDVGSLRLRGKFKLHDRVPGSMGVDEEIVCKLATIKAQRLHPLDASHGRYNVYIIGSLSGGTGSGAIPDIPALVRKAFRDPQRVAVNAMLYTPDAVVGLDPAGASALHANGYAALKEINYYMGMYMRPEYAETWSYNDASSPELTYQTPNLGCEGFINIPYLIGTHDGPKSDSARVAMETIAQMMVSILGRITASDGWPFFTEEWFHRTPFRVAMRDFMPGVPEMEAPGAAHEFPRRFASIGFAEATIPQKLVRAYTVGRACEMAGFKPVSAETRVALATDPAALLPFRGKDDLLNATEGTAKAVKMLEPISKIMAVIHSGNFSFSRDLNEQEITWTKIKNHQYDTPLIAAKTWAVIKARTDDNMMNELKQKIKEAFWRFRVNVQDYVREEGPYAFYNLYHGHFIPVGDNLGMGIAQMLQNLVQGRQMDGKTVYFFSVEDAKATLDHARDAIVSKAPGVFGIEGGVHHDQCAKWVAAYDKLGTARINQVRRDTALGAHGALSQSFLQPAAKLAEELEAFGCILETMADVYKAHGRKLESYEEFCGAHDNKTDINLAAMSDASYQWLKRKADGALLAVRGRKLRDHLVDHFFDKGFDGIPNSRLWLEYPNDRITVAAGGKIKLVRKEMPAPARVIFDEIMAEEFPSTVQVSIEEFFNIMNACGHSLDAVAYDVIAKLYAESKPLFNGKIPAASSYGYLMYPSALTQTANGQAIAKALESAADQVCPGVQVYATDDACSIRFFQLACNLEIYRLADLKLWEDHYENGTRGIQNPNALLHGLSPDLTAVTVPNEGTTYTENLPWADYPPLTVPERDPRLIDPKTGTISREGKILIELDKLIARARELGVLYSEHTPEGWIVKRVHCDDTREWFFDAMTCMPDPMTGLLPMGKALAETVASQNGKTLEQMSRKVSLNMAGVMSNAHVTEDFAWKYASRTLRAHVPMFIEVRETVKLFEPWATEINEFNITMLTAVLPAKLVWLVKGRILRREEDGTWVYITPDGEIRDIAILTDPMIKFQPPVDKTLIERGCLAYYLYHKLNRILQDVHQWEEAYTRAIANIRSEGTSDDAAATWFIAEAERIVRLSPEEESELYSVIAPDERNRIRIFYERLLNWEYLY